MDFKIYYKIMTYKNIIEIYKTNQKNIMVIYIFINY